jgi:hypothetical protein
MNLGPCLHKPPLSLRKAASDSLNRVDREDADLVLIVSASLVLGSSRMLFFQFHPRFRRFECKVFLTEALRYMDARAGPA